jgi:SAM-dependent methyltransferase
MSVNLRERVLGEEILDRADDETAASNLRDLERIHRLLGGASIVASRMREVASREEEIQVLDAGAAGGWLGRALVRDFPRARVTSLDLRERNLRLGGGARVAADLASPPFRDGSFDVVIACLFLHHFDDESAARMLERMAALSSRAVIVVDLWRLRAARAFLPATRGLFGWSEITVHDGRLSVEAGFTLEELRSLGEVAGLCNPRVARHWPWLRLSLLARARPVTLKS